MLQKKGKHFLTAVLGGGVPSTLARQGPGHLVALWPESVAYTIIKAVH